MEELIITTKIALANTFMMYFKAHSYHWNVEAHNFSEMHDFFGGVYEEVFGAVDPLAEEIRMLDAYAPISLNEIYTYKTIQEDPIKPDSVRQMLMNLDEANGKVLESLERLFATADKMNQQGLADFATARIDAHRKHRWMTKSFLKGE